MNLSFDHYHNLQRTELYLCNPDGRQLFPLVGFDRQLTLRFNDLFELSFSCYATTTASDGTVVPVDAYDYIQTRRLVFATGIGWFVIDSSNEHDNGVVKYKTVTCSSQQASLKDVGFHCEERVYYLYNASDPTDANYDATNDASVPSVVGQMFRQLGIQQNLDQGLPDPDEPYSEWTITYVNPDLIGVARNFNESTTFGYDWIVGDVEAAFGVVVLFDCFYKTIHIMYPDEVTSKANVIYTFSNFMKDIEISEDASNIVTVMNCRGDNCDITTVNPTGTNYICDFSYYMDDAGRWMSTALKTKINAWKADVAEAKPGYVAKVQQLRAAFDEMTSLNSSLQEISQIYTDLSTAANNKVIATAESTSLTGIVWCETVAIGATSLDEHSVFSADELSHESEITAYKAAPTYDATTGIWTLSGAHYTGTVDECFSYVDEQNNQYLYFCDPATGFSATSYCKLQGKSQLNKETQEAEYICGGFKRYGDLSIAARWMTKYDEKKAAMKTAITAYETTIALLQTELGSIASSLNIINYFIDTPSLLKELRCYWIEGDYTNENIAVGETTTQAEAIDLANELLASGESELAKVCQPKLQFSLTSADCTKQYEFRDQMRALELGKIITVEKAEGVWYYPALLEMTYNLDTADSFSLKFANALRLDDWGYTYGDLMSNAETTSRQVSANWQNIMAYSNEKKGIEPLIKAPLSATLHAAFANMDNQSFIVNDTGILGRRFSDPAVRDSFDDEQMRITNNVILFTDDNWQTVRSALGKISYYNEQEQLVTAYGLVGDAIIGTLLMGEKLSIKNSGNSIVLDGAGITIKNGNDIVFSANTNGDLTARGTVYAASGNIGGFNIDDNSFYSGTEFATSDVFLCTGSIATITIAGHTGSGWALKAGNKFGVNTAGELYCTDANLTGTITATSGTIGSQTHSFTIGSNGTSAHIYCDLPTLPRAGGYAVQSNRAYFGTDGFAYKADYTDVNYDYSTVIKSDFIITYGDGNGSGNYNRATVMRSSGLVFFNAGNHKIDDIVLSSYEIAAIKLGNGANYALMSGTWKSTSSISIVSDQNQKHDIEDLDDRYSLMIDNLRPRRFKYNDGTSNRYHTGFIAQEMKAAMDEAGLSTTDIAAYIEAHVDGHTELSIRYEELVALNTSEIQKIKHRLSAVEAALAK